MAKDAEFDPLNVAAALSVLESELQPELSGEDAAQALRLLQIEVAAVTAQARAWAERHAIAVECIPEAPDPDSGAQAWTVFLVRLASVLECLGTQAALSPAPPHLEILADTWRALIALQGEALQLNDDLERLEGLGQATAAGAAVIRNRSRSVLQIVERLLSELDEFRATDPVEH